VLTGPSPRGEQTSPRGEPEALEASETSEVATAVAPSLLDGSTSQLHGTAAAKPPKKRKCAADLACPVDVEPQVFADLLALRKAKKAPFTETVLKSSREQAHKAGMSLNDFMIIWCRRGSQGLEASWIKPDERPASGADNPFKGGI